MLQMLLESGSVNRIKVQSYPSEGRVGLRGAQSQLLSFLGVQGSPLAGFDKLYFLGRPGREWDEEVDPTKVFERQGLRVGYSLSDSSGTL